MLQYVMTKLETHNINSDGQIMPNHIEHAADEDSGTETDDETGGPDEDTMDLTDDESHLMPRPSSMPAMYKLGSSYDEETGSSSSSCNEPIVKDKPLATPTFFVSTCQNNAASDVDGGSHSSEEELEEINNIPLSSSSSSATTPPPLAATTPVEFSTTPPNHVYKPRRSKSPPFISSSTCQQGGVACYQDSRSQDMIRSERRAIASKKRYKQSRIHHIQRPCLDFEKMQLLKTRAITSWRHGGELSLFCW